MRYRSAGTTTSAVSTGRPEAKYSARWMTTTTCPGTPPSARSSSARPARAPTSSVTLSTITSMAAIRSTTPVPERTLVGEHHRGAARDGEAPRRWRASSPGRRPGRRSSCTSRGRRAGIERRSAIAPLASACSLCNSRCRARPGRPAPGGKGSLHCPGRYPERATERHGHSAHTSRAGAALDQPFGHQHLARFQGDRVRDAVLLADPGLEGRRVCGGSEPSTIFLRRSPATRRYAGCSPKSLAAPSGCTDSYSLATVGCAMQAKAKESLDVITNPRRRGFTQALSPRCSPRHTSRAPPLPPLPRLPPPPPFDGGGWWGPEPCVR